ncbi:hypothetical protein PF001_g20267, partial [Phytophthora fragariae]
MGFCLKSVPARGP